MGSMLAVALVAATVVGALEHDKADPTHHLDGSAPSHFHHGNRLLRSGDAAGAEAAYHQAAALNPTDPAFYVNLCAVVARGNRFDEAEGSCRSALALAPSMGRAHMALAQVWLQQGAAKRKDAFKRLARGAALSPDDAEIRLSFGQSLLKHERIDECVGNFMSAVALRPNDSSVRDKLGYALSKGERLVEARLWLESAEVVAAPEKPSHNAMAKLIEVLHWLGDEEQAKRVARRAVEVHGLWRDPLQRPTTFYRPELLAKPRWYVDDGPAFRNAATHLSSPAMVEALRAEYFLVERKRPGGWRHQPERVQRPGVGRWKEWKVLDDRVKPCRRAIFPQTCKALDELASLVTLQWAEFSVVEPGAHIRRHTGPTNDRLTLHLCLADGRSSDVSRQGLDNSGQHHDSDVGGATLRIGNSSLEEYRNGTIIFLDDSFEHEVFHGGVRDRVVLLVQFAHPGFPSQPQRPTSWNRPLASDQNEL